MEEYDDYIEDDVVNNEDKIVEIKDEIIETRTEKGEAWVVYKDQVKKLLPTMTTYTIWKSGRQDCHVDILEPLDSVAKEEKLGGK